MPGTGTLINALAVIGGGVAGLAFRRGLPVRFQETIMQALGLSSLFIGLSGALAIMLKVDGSLLSTSGTMITVLSLVGGAVLGELLNIEYRFEQFGRFLKERTGSDKDSLFMEGFITTSLTICIGAMAIVGALQDGMLHDPSMLITKAVLDAVIVMIFASAYGKGPLFAVIPLVLLQGGVTMAAGWIQPFLTAFMIENLSMIGSMLIFCVGLNLMLNTKIKVANLLPALILCVLLPLVL